MAERGAPSPMPRAGERRVHPRPGRSPRETVTLIQRPADGNAIIRVTGTVVHRGLAPPYKQSSNGK